MGKFGRPDAVSREVAFVKAQKFPLDDFAKALAVRFLDMLYRPGADVCVRRLLVHAFTDDISDEMAYRGSVIQSERVGARRATCARPRIARRTADRPR